MKKLLACVFLSGLMAAGLAQTAEAPSDIKINITPVTDDLYRFQYHMHYSAFLVTDEGIIVTDPVTEEAALWLKEELKRRFNKPVRYMIYSHHHSDHIGGANIFAGESVSIVSHQLAKEALIKLDDTAKLPIPDITFDNEMTISLGGKTVR
jgi:glyoxylase-like metal-dependent hydrolase (beta-lactamase superfamily II)